MGNHHFFKYRHNNLNPGRMWLISPQSVTVMDSTSWLWTSHIYGTFLLLFFSPPLHNLIIFFVVIKCQMLNKFCFSPQAPITSRSALLSFLEVIKLSTWLRLLSDINISVHSLGGTFCIYRGIARIWLWDSEFLSTGYYLDLIVVIMQFLYTVFLLMMKHTFT